jgi:hypothetical protein
MIDHPLFRQYSTGWVTNAIPTEPDSPVEAPHVLTCAKTILGAFVLDVNDLEKTNTRQNQVRGFPQNSPHLFS